ncbi:uncharacterized protein LOC110032725 [Phalaenopsis equestris]|uniref:uncharacterized protein LOC110032725 n=1 Tax=Phalaenopsis equestris TaxID=78828 RepID=UPI0009E35E96|nr:uncharacterized protein LOC110032725 [Phalaenopsis equestris]
MKYDELNHFSHPQHKLRFEYSELPFKCDGCREVGIGSRFKCSLCDFDLHTHCSAAAAAIPLPHPFYPKCVFYFLPRPPGDSPRYCNACNRDIAGFVYHCRMCGFDLHPCCAALPHVLHADGDLRLLLRRLASAPCHRCGRKGRSWSYRSECRKYELHVACVMEILVDSWREIYYGGGGEGKKMRVSDIRVPSIRGAEISHHRSGKGKGKVKRCCELAAMAVQFVISAVLGDPTAVIAGVVSSFLFR